MRAAVFLGLLSCGLALPSTMRAVYPTKFIGTNYTALSAGSKDVPKPGRSQVLIAVNTSSVNPCDVDLMKSWLEAEAAIVLKKTLGFDVSGVVVAVGAGCTRLKVGDEVWTDLGDIGLKAGIAEMGAFADFALAEEVQVGLKPSTLDFVEAGVMPLVGITNYQAFIKAGAPWDAGANKTVVITSGEGGTGHLAIQMARNLGAGFIVTAADTAHLDYVRALGADLAVDFTKASLWDVLPEDSVDVIYDNYGEDADSEMGALRAGGVLVMIQGKLAKKAKAGTKQYKILASTKTHVELDAMKAWAEAGTLKPTVQQGFPLEQVGQAYATDAAGGVVGKLAVRVA